MKKNGHRENESLPGSGADVEGLSESAESSPSGEAILVETDPEELEKIEYKKSVEISFSNAKRYSHESSLARAASEQKTGTRQYYDKDDKTRESTPTSLSQRKKEFKTKNKGIGGSLMRSVDAVHLYLKGSKHPVELRAFAGYLGETVTSLKEETLDFDYYTGQDKKAEFRKEGIKVLSEEMYKNKEGKTRYRFKVMMPKPFHFEPHDSANLDKLLGKKNDPVLVMDSLSKFGLQITTELLSKEKIDALAVLVDTPDFLARMAKVDEIGFRAKSGSPEQTVDEKCELLVTLGEVLNDQNVLNLLNEQGEAMRELIFKTSMIVFPDRENLDLLCSCVSIPQVKFALLSLNDHFSWKSSLQNKYSMRLLLKMNKSGGVLENLTKLTSVTKVRVFRDLQKIMDSVSEDESKDEEIISGVRNIIETPPCSELLVKGGPIDDLQILTEWTGQKIEQDAVNLRGTNLMGYVKEHSKEVVAYFAQLKDIGLKPFPEDGYSLCDEVAMTSAMILGDRYKDYKEAFFNPQLKKIHELFGYKFKLEQFINYRDYDPYKNYFDSNIMDLYDRRKEAEILFSPRGTRVVQFMGVFHFDYLDDYIELLSNPNPEVDTIVEELQSRNIILSNPKEFFDLLPKLLELQPEKRFAYLDILQKIKQTPSQEVKRLEKEIIEGVLESDDPVVAFGKIERIFIKNHLPLVGKVYKVFETLFSPEKFAKCLADKPMTSPVLQHASMRRRRSIVYQDLLKVHIESSNRSLRNYIEVLQSGERVMAVCEERGVDTLSKKEQEELSYLVEKLETLYENSDLSQKTVGHDEVESIPQKVEKVREMLKVAPGQKFSDRIHEMFLAPSGYKDLSSVISEMDQARKSAHERGVQVTQQEGILIPNGAIVKGVNAKFIANILQNGSVSKEYLGGSSTQDSTPFDTDVSLLPAIGPISPMNAITHSLAAGYGDILLVVKDRGQFSVTRDDKGEEKKYDPTKLEIFHTGVAGQDHAGIRTGFPSTEIDYMIVKRELLGEKYSFENLCLEIAQNAFYIPIYSEDEKLIFTPAQYEEYRKLYKGIDYFNGDPLVCKETVNTDPQYQDVQKIIDEKKEGASKIEATRISVISSLRDVLVKQGINFKSEFDTGTLGAEIIDIGSTGRNTNISNDNDFDLTLKLDGLDFAKAKTIADALKELCVFETDNSHEERGGYQQLRFSKVTKIGDVTFGEPVDVDMGIASNSDMDLYDTNDALDEKYSWIKKNGGEKVYDDVIANVVLAKKILKEAKAYKKSEDGGIGGVGVENWILLNDGNLEVAFKSFKEAAYSGKEVRPLKDFKEQYKVIDPGINIKKGRHDNFIGLLTEEGYKKMLSTIEDYLDKHAV